MEQNNTFEKKIRDAFDGFEANPPDRVLARIKETVASKQGLATQSGKISRSLAWVAGGAIILTLAYFGLKEPGQPEQIVVEQPVFVEQPEHAQVIQPKEETALISSSDEKAEAPAQPKKAKPVLTANAGSDQLVCGLETELNTQLSNPSASGRWEYASRDGRKVSIEKSDIPTSTSVKVEEAGRYKFRWIEELDGVASSDELEVDFVSMNTISAGADQKVCGLVVELISTGANGSWMALQESKIESPSHIKSIFEVTLYGAHQFVWIEKLGNCQTSDTVAVDFIEMPKAEILIVKQANCFGDPIHIKSQVKSGIDYIWDFKDASSSKISGQEYLLTWKEGGQHTIALQVANTICKDEQQISVDYPEEMKAEFLVSDPGDEVPALVYFTNMSTLGDKSYDMVSGIQFQWKFGNGETSNLPNPDYLYTKEGIYFPVLEMTNAKRCKSTYAGPKLIVKDLNKGPGTIVMTPNGDGKNDVFAVDASGFQSFTCVVLSLGGERLHSWSDPQGVWDGRLNDGSLASRGTYYYIIKAVDLNGKPVEIPGVIYLYRE